MLRLGTQSTTAGLNLAGRLWNRYMGLFAQDTYILPQLRS